MNPWFFVVFLLFALILNTITNLVMFLTYQSRQMRKSQFWAGYFMTCGTETRNLIVQEAYKAEQRVPLP